MPKTPVDMMANEVAVMEAITLLDKENAVEAAKEVLRAATERLANGSVAKTDFLACLVLLRRHIQEFTRTGAKLAPAVPRLTELVSEHDASQSHGLVGLARALWLFDEHGSREETETARLLAEVSSDGHSRDKAHWAAVGASSEHATTELVEGNGAPLFYLMLQEFNAAWHDHAMCPWLIRHLDDARFWSWLQAQETLPLRPPAAEGLNFEELNLTGLAKKARSTFRHGNIWKYWPGARREVLAALLLLAPEEDLSYADAFEHMALVGDLDAVNFLWTRGLPKERIDVKTLRHVARRAALHGQVAVLRRLNEFGLSKRDRGTLFRRVCSTADERKTGTYGSTARDLRRDGAVLDALMEMGVSVDLDEALVSAMSAWRHDAIRALLRHGADRAKFEALVDGDANVKRFFVRHGLVVGG